MNNQTAPPVEWIRGEFLRRKALNRRYSLRAFARFLQVPSGRLSEILSHKRPLTPRMGEDLSRRLSLSASQRRAFLEAIQTERERVAAFQKVGSSTSPESAIQALSYETFEVIADWEHFAILSLMKTSGFKMSAAWIARRLGISKEGAEKAIDRLVRVGLIRQEADGRWVRTGKQLTTTHDLESAALKRSHTQSLEQVIQALSLVPVSERDITSMTMAIDPSRIPLAKTLIKNFRRTLSDLLEEGERTEVYNLNVSLVPVTKPGGAR